MNYYDYDQIKKAGICFILMGGLVATALIGLMIFTPPEE